MLICSTSQKNNIYKPVVPNYLNPTHFQKPAYFKQIIFKVVKSSKVWKYQNKSWSAPLATCINGESLQKSDWFLMRSNLICSNTEHLQVQLDDVAWIH